VSRRDSLHIHQLSNTPDVKEVADILKEDRKMQSKMLTDSPFPAANTGFIKDD